MAVIPANCSGQADSCESQYISGLGTTNVCCCGGDLCNSASYLGLSGLLALLIFLLTFFSL